MPGGVEPTLRKMSFISILKGGEYLNGDIRPASFGGVADFVGTDYMGVDDVSIVKKCKAQHLTCREIIGSVIALMIGNLTWKEVIGCILFVLFGSINFN